MKRYIVALDLHGTLLDINWEISDGCLGDLVGHFDDMSGFADFYIVTGNDFSFVQKYLPSEILERMHGFILESGGIMMIKSTMTDKSQTKRLENFSPSIVDNATADCVKELKEYFIKKKYSFIKYFAERQVSISMFTIDENGGEEPTKYFETIYNDLRQHKYSDMFYLTWSNVALDIIPVGVSKWESLKKIAENYRYQNITPDDVKAGNPDVIISFLDSYNDKEMALNSTYTFLPQNTSNKLIEYLQTNNKLVFPLSKFYFLKNFAYILDQPFTQGVSQGLFFLKNNICNLSSPNHDFLTINNTFNNEAVTRFKKPEWIPDNAGSEYASHILPPTTKTKSINNLTYTKPKNLTLKDYIEGVLSHDKIILARAITLIESNAEKHFELAQELLKEIIPYAGKSIRLGISGVPGAGKSTFIESFGMYLIERGKTPAILAIDPSSTVSKGSILGDKTRMENLSKNNKAFIRPSPSAGNLGGVARKTRETMYLCEAAGFDVIVVETVGVGQSEVTVRSMVDFFLLILIAGAGDELQGIKKGVIELADAILINKSDGDNIIKAETTKSQYNNALHYLADATAGWKTRAFTCSAIESKGIENIWGVINEYILFTERNNLFNERRLYQTKLWFESMLNEEILKDFYTKRNIKENLQKILTSILSNEITPVMAVKKMLEYASLK